ENQTMLNEAKINETLMLASWKGHTETVKALLDAGADVHTHEDHALRWASENGHTKTATLLREAMKTAPAPEAISRLQEQFKVKAGKELTRTEAMTAFRIVRTLDAATPPAP